MEWFSHLHLKRWLVIRGSMGFDITGQTAKTLTSTVKVTHPPSTQIRPTSKEHTFMSCLKTLELSILRRLLSRTQRSTLTTRKRGKTRLSLKKLSLLLTLYFVWCFFPLMCWITSPPLRIKLLHRRQLNPDTALTNSQPGENEDKGRLFKNSYVIIQTGINKKAF